MTHHLHILRPDNPGWVAMPSASARALRIVLAEDDALVRMTVAGLLEDMGHVVVEAACGQEALAALESVSDMLISDMHLPGMTGEALAEEALAHHPGLAVLIASGDPPDGANRHVWLQKPFTSARLRDAVEAAMAAA